jgi:hypothetical protein
MRYAMPSRLVVTLLSIVVLHGLARCAGADETFYRVPLGDLKVEGGELPADGEGEDWSGRSP